jgi:hypothetical protein
MFHLFKIRDSVVRLSARAQFAEEKHYLMSFFRKEFRPIQLESQA